MQIKVKINKNQNDSNTVKIYNINVKQLHAEPIDS